jgi:hypothetical protein
MAKPSTAKYSLLPSGENFIHHSQVLQISWEQTPVWRTIAWEPYCCKKVDFPDSILNLIANIHRLSFPTFHSSGPWSEVL